MGQRSQIYFRCNTLYGKYLLVAKYFQWNYGTRLVSRARGILEWLDREKEFATLFYNGSSTIERLKRVMEINWDYKDVVVSQDIVDEYKRGLYSEPKEIFTGQDNNDGQLLIDMIIDYEHNNKKGHPIVKFKYAFLDWNSENPMNGDDYMQWDYDYGDSDRGPWRDDKYVKEEIKYTERNIRFIGKHAELMTALEVEDFINHDYMKDMGIEFKEEA